MSETLSETYTRLVPASRKPTREQQLRYLQLREEGLTHTRAARSVGSTGRRFRSLLRRDEEFKAAYEELLPDFEMALQERLRNEIVERGFDRKDPASPRLLALMAEARLPEMDYRRTRRINQHTTGTMRHEHAISLDPRALSTEKLEQLRAVLAEADDSDVIDGGFVRELPREATG